jgi:hypothetical protein
MLKTTAVVVVLIFLIKKYYTELMLVSNQLSLFYNVRTKHMNELLES